MRKIRFFIALWAGKLLLFVFKRIGRTRDDKPGMASMRLCEDFLAQVAKPELTIAVTGTNGKTSISSMVAEMLSKQGLTVSYNDWGANHHAGQARCILDTVSIFNKPVKDACVIESDELISPINIPRIKPNYMIVNNVARDSMLRNANPEYIAGQLRKACDGSPETVVIINADDPLCCFIGEKNRKVYFGADYLHTNPFENIAKDFSVCPVCGASVKYEYRNYRHIGKFICTDCGVATPARDFLSKGVSADSTSISVEEKAGCFDYPLISRGVHNVYNTTAIVALMRDLGNSPEEVARLLSVTKLPEFRETRHFVDDVEVICRVAKGQNATSVSTVFEHLAKDESKKELIILLDEIFENPKKQETVAWIYDTDYEFLNNDNIRKIVIGGPRCKDHYLRLLLAGLPKEKICCVKDIFETAKLVDHKGVDKIFVLHDVNCVSRGHAVRDAVIEHIKAKGGKVNAR